MSDKLQEFYKSIQVFEQQLDKFEKTLSNVSKIRYLFSENFQDFIQQVPIEKALLVNHYIVKFDSLILSELEKHGGYGESPKDLQKRLRILSNEREEQMNKKSEDLNIKDIADLFNPNKP